VGSLLRRVGMGGGTHGGRRLNCGHDCCVRCC
jgi:hypothetical protein